jgi:23S rRNA pseudouridine2605 synthase
MNQDKNYTIAANSSTPSHPPPPQRLSKLLSNSLALSRRECERHIRAGDVTLAGQVVDQPHLLVGRDDWSAIKWRGKSLATRTMTQLNNNTDNFNKPRVWLVHKLAGELVAESDPQNRPLLMDRLKRGGVGKNMKTKQRVHLKPVGRLDVGTEGLIIVTNNGAYARELELPSNQLHRTYKVRVHGALTQQKVDMIQRGVTTSNGTRYRGMKVHVETPRKGKINSTNKWIELTCTEGKNRQIRNVLQHFGCK